jgi:hypothetical protein
MDPNLIYAKTVSGEEAMRLRTRVVQRNMRMVLILVDGNATVADLSAKTGNVQLVENALRELEQSGFIAPLVEQDSVWEQSKKVAEEIKAATVAHASQKQVASSIRDAETFVSPPMPPVSVVAGHQAADSLPPEFSVAPAVQPENILLDDSRSDLGANGLAESLKAGSCQERVKQPALISRLKAYFLDRKQQAADDDFSVNLAQRSSTQYYFSWPVKVVFGVFFPLVMAFLTILLFPYHSYLPEVEAALAQAIGQPVKIGEVGVSFFPKSGFILKNVRFENTVEAKEIRISELRLLPIFGTMMTSRKEFRYAVLSGVTLPAEALTGLSGIFEAAAQPSAKASVQHIVLEKAEISFRGLGFSELNGEIDLAPEGHFQLLTLHSPDRSVRLEVKPAAKGVDIVLESFSWRPSPASSFLVDSATVQGNLEGAELRLNKLELRTFDGLIQGVAILRAENEPSMAGKISFERISAKRFCDFLGLGQQFEGETAGEMSFSATANSWAALFSGVVANGAFNVRRGNLGGFDLAEAARRASVAPIQGGETRFEQLSGMFSLTSSGYRFSSLLLTSGLMQSSGQLDVSKDLQVNGRLEVKMSGTVNKLRMPLTINGSLKMPLLRAGTY